MLNNTMQCNLQNPACVKPKGQMTQFLQRAIYKLAGVEEGWGWRHKELTLGIVAEELVFLFLLYALHCQRVHLYFLAILGLEVNIEGF